MNTSSDNFSPIPEPFHSFKTDGPFTHCIECEKYLLDGEDYMIEKACRQYPGFKATDVIFDCAICMECAMNMQKDISEESKQTMQSFLGNHFNSSRRQALVRENRDDNALIEECLVSGKKKSDCNEYQIFALCKGGVINPQFRPYMISGEALEQLTEMLSAKTKENLGGFFNKHFSPDPDLVGQDPRLVIF
ncbi:MAG: hypothetical protein JXR10_02195 [Cyclobacteriaceae bacterium]